MTDPAPSQRGQIFKAEDDVVVVEWYDFGEDVAYEFAVQLRFDAANQAKLADALGMSEEIQPPLLADTLKDRFGNYWAVRQFADERDIPYEVARDFQP